MKKNINTIISWGSGVLKLENILKAMEFSSQYSNIWFFKVATIIFCESLLFIKKIIFCEIRISHHSGHLSYGWEFRLKIIMRSFFSCFLQYGTKIKMKWIKVVNKK